MTAGNRERIYHTTSIRYAEPLRPSREAAGYGCPTTLSLRCRGVYGVPRWQTQLAAPLVLRGQHRRSPDLGCAQFGGGALFFGEGVCGIERPPPVLRRNRQTRCGVVPGGQPTTVEPSFQSCDATPQAAPAAAPRSAGLVAQRVSLWGSDNDNCVNGGWGGIRTPGEREPTPVFKTGALNHSATHPRLQIDSQSTAAARPIPYSPQDCR